MCAALASVFLSQPLPSSSSSPLSALKASDTAVLEMSVLVRCYRCCWLKHIHGRTSHLYRKARDSHTSFVLTRHLTIKEQSRAAFGEVSMAV